MTLRPFHPFLTLGLWLWCGAWAALAQESTTTLGAGGLVLARTAQISLERQTLAVGLDEIRVEYVFRNSAEKDAAFLLTFPMPEIDAGDLLEAPVTLPKSDAENFLDFRIAVDGKPISPRIEQRAFGLGLDVTDMLKADGLPLNPAVPDAGRALASLAQSRKDEYAKRGLAVFDSADSVFPLWTVTTIAFWEQTFPVDKAVSIQLRYRPVAGAFPIAADVKKEDLPLDDYCADDAAWTAIARKLAGRTEPLAAFDVQYVLTAGASWMGPIKEFELTVEKPDKDAVISLCLDEARTVGQRIEFKAADFVPEQDLRVLVVPGKGR